MQDEKATMGYEKGVYPSDEYLRNSLRDGELFKLKDGETLIGCVILNNKTNEGYKGIHWSKDLPSERVFTPHALSVSPDCQGKGMGKQMVTHIIEYCKTKGAKAIRLDILGANPKAEHLYSAMGFHFVEAKNMFYEDTGWTIYKMMELNLD